MSKKGLELFSAMISIFTMIVLVTAGYFLIVEPKITGGERIIGKEAFVIYDLDMMARSRVFRLDEGLKYASYNALVKFGEEGGGCKEWYNCTPDINKFKDYVEDEYLKVLEGLKLRRDEIENFTISIKLENKSFVVSGYGKEELRFRRVGEGVTYKVPFGPFVEKIDYDLSIYSKLHEMYSSRDKCDKKEELIEDLSVKIKCDDSGDEIHINVELSTNDLLFVDPIIKFKLPKKIRLIKTGG